MTMINVMPAGAGWKIDGDERTYDTQEDAIDAARTALQGLGGGELVIHGNDGRIRAKDTIASHDPRDIPG